MRGAVTVQIGKMRDRVTVCENGFPHDNTSDWNGDADRKPAELFTVWANINPQWGRRFFAEDTEGMERADTVFVRYRREITPEKLLRYNGKDHKITAQKDIDNRHVYLALKCEVVENG